MLDHASKHMLFFPRPIVQIKCPRYHYTSGNAYQLYIASTPSRFWPSSASACFVWISLWGGTTWHDVNTLRPRQNGRHFSDDIFKCIFLNKNMWISIKISLQFLPKSPINNVRTLIQIMVWCRSGNKPLSEPMIRLPTHICVTRLQIPKIDNFWTKIR